MRESFTWWCVGAALVGVMSDNPFASLIACLLIGVVASLINPLPAIRAKQERASIKFDETHVEGPVLRSRRRARIPIDKIDRERTRQWSLAERLLGRKYVWSVEGKQIYIDWRAFGDLQLKVFAERLGTSI